MQPVMIHRTPPDDPLSPSVLRSVCEELARLGAAAAWPFYQRIRTGRAIGVQSKADDSPVTEADLAAQQAMANAILQHFPHAGLLGEETLQPAAQNTLPPIEQARLVFIVDPIDGTRNFLSGLPLWAVLVAACVDGVPVASATLCPALQTTYAAAAGHGATRNGEPMAVSPASRTPNSLMGCPSPRNGRIEPFAEHWFLNYTGRNLGSAGLHLACVAEGSFAAAAGPECRLWDLAAGWLLVHESGGRVTGFAGQELFPGSLQGYAGQCVPWIASAADHAGLLEQVRAIDPAAAAG